MKKYIVKFPNPDTNEIIEKTFYNLDDVTKFLNVGPTVVYNIIKGNYAYKKNTHLKSITITKEKVNNDENKGNTDEEKEKTNEFLRKLIMNN